MKKIVMSILMLAMLIGIVACSSQSSGSEEADAEKKVAGEKDSGSSLVDEIKERGTLTMAMGGKYPPFNFVNKNNELDGFDVDIAKEIAKRMGVEAKPVSTEWDAIITGLLTEKYDIILGSMSITEERQQKADFVQYYTSGAAIIVPEDSKIKGKEDLEGANVGVGLGTTYEEEAVKLGANVKTYSSSVDGFNDMINGRIDAVISDQLLAANGIKEKGYPFKIVGEKLFEDPCGIAIRKDNPELKKEIETIMEEMRQDGTYTKISEKWFDMDIR